MIERKSDVGQLRFAAYLRTSTEDQQSPAESRRWQLARAEALISGHGEITVVFHDVGQSRSLPWKRRPEATALLEEAARKDRRFDAVVIAEPARAFAGAEFANVLPVLTHWGVELWVPEIGGRVDPDSEAHDLLLMLFGGMSKGERARIKVRVRSAMAAQALEGRFLGGRPPYGYVLADAGPHPNPGKAKDGKRLHRLEPDPVAAPVVLRIFASYLQGMGLRQLAEQLTAEGIPSPSAHDPERNRHRQASKGAWSRACLRAILLNPVYRGTQVWRKQRREEVLYDVEDPAAGHKTVLRWNTPDAWVSATEPTHTPLVDEATFQGVQEKFRGRQGGRGPRALAKGRRPYALRGRVICEACGKRLEAVTIEDRRYYRCRLQGPDYARSPELELTHPRAAYLREDRLLPAVNGWLARKFDPEHLDETAAALAQAAGEERGSDAQADRWRRRLADAEGKLTKYQRAIEEGVEVSVVSAWINEAERQRREAESELARLLPDRPPTADEVKDLLIRLGSIVERLNQADPEVLAETYEALGLKVTWAPKADRAVVEITSREDRVGGGT